MRHLIVRRIHAEWRHDGRVDLRLADDRGVRRARPDAEAGRAAVSYENVIGLALSVLLAAYLAAALLFPERF